MRLDLHEKPIIFLDNDDYWTPMLSLIDHIIDMGFSPAWMKKRIFSADTSRGAIELARACLDRSTHEKSKLNLKTDQM